ncbi:MAG: hypothetical protein WCK43_05165 [bacterium]
MFKTVAWNLGKLLQLIALIQAPYALYVGVTTNDARLELKYLGLAVIQFLIGLGVVKWSSKG